MKSEDLSAILDFLYCGEANVFQEKQDFFLAIAEELKLKGLMGQSETKDEKAQEFDPSIFPKQMRPQVAVQKQPTGFKSAHADQKLTSVFERTVAIQNFITEDLQELDEQVKSMMENSLNMVQVGKRQKRAKICKLCGKEGPPTTNSDHIEAHHLDGVSLPCNNCEKTFRSSVTKR